VKAPHFSAGELTAASVLSGQGEQELVIREVGVAKVVLDLLENLVLEFGLVAVLDLRFAHVAKLRKRFK
jgi:hypothetical protein